MARTLRGAPQRVALGHGFQLRYAPTFEVTDDPDLEYHIELTVELQEGRLVCSQFTARQRAGGPPVTADGLKALPVVRLIQQAVKGSSSGTSWLGLWKHTSGSRWDQAQPEDLEALDELPRTAVIYRLAFVLGMNPTLAVAEQLGTSRDVAAKRVQAARRAGLLEPTTKGRKGT